MSDHPRAGSSSTPPDWDAIARHLAGGGSSEERAAMESAISADPARSELLAALGRAVHTPDPAPPSAAEIEMALRSVLARRDAEPIRPTTPKVLSVDAYRRRGMALRAAAAIIVVVGAGLLWRTSVGSAPATNNTAATSHYASAVGAIDSVTLSDGTRILLGPGSSVTLAAGFGDGARDVTLVGEARFDVRHDADRPFTVHAGHATFRDIGTVFSVHSDGDEGARIAVSEGIVSVRGKSGDAAVTLQKGDRAAVAPDGALNVERAAVIAEDTAWTSGHLVFRDATVAQMVSDVRRWYGIDVRVDPALAGHHLSAEFDRSSAADVGRVIAAVLGGGFRQDGSTLYIVPPPSGVAPR